MRSIWLVILMSALSGCANSKECTQKFGLDPKVPEEVKIQLKKEGMDEYQLIDRLSCPNSIQWIALPPQMPIDQPRPPGVGHLITFDPMTHQVQVAKGQ